MIRDKICIIIFSVGVSLIVVGIFLLILINMFFQIQNNWKNILTYYNKELPKIEFTYELLKDAIFYEISKARKLIIALIIFGIVICLFATFLFF